MSKLSIICLFLLTICILSNLSSEESNRNDTESVKIEEHRIQKRIVGGWFTEEHQETVFKLELNESHICTGTFIAPNAILTAAHCCENVNSSSVIFFLPPYEDIIIEVTVLKYHIHPDYYESGDSNHDIAIIELAENISYIIEYDRWIIPATLDYTEVECGSTVWMYGYGLTDSNQVEGTFKLKELPAEVVMCNWYVRIIILPYLRDDRIHTYATSGSICLGDSGGPVLGPNGAIVGVISGITKNCSTSIHIKAVRISSHKHFIQSALHLNSASKITLHFNSLSFFILIIFYYIF